MAGWFLHLDIARRAARSIDGATALDGILTSDGPDGSALRTLAEGQPGYLALGAIGPDLFFLLPDFKPPMGGRLWTVAATVREIYSALDTHLLEPLADNLGPVLDGYGDLANAVSGGLLGQLGEIAELGTKIITDALKVVAIRQYDFMSLLSSGVPAGFDEQLFFWSDTLHYRQTYRVATRLWQRAGDEADPVRRERFQAYALGWMAHLGTDVITHTFVNQKVGGPYRNHWQRHHLVENHMDARVYNDQVGGDGLYPNVSSSALHLWLAFNPDGSSRVDCFQPQPGPDYDPGDGLQAELSRKGAWDLDPVLPDDLAAFLAATIRDVYTEDLQASPLGQEACCPTILSALDERVPIEGNGAPVAEDIELAYWYMFQYVKKITTDFYTLRPPEAPQLIELPAFPPPPGSGAESGPDENDAGVFDDILEFLVALLAWILYLGEIILWALSLLPSLVASLATYPARAVLHELVELPLYNMWLGLHYFLTMTGYTLPLPGEINQGLTQLGRSPQGSWPEVLVALDLVDGGLIAGSQPNEASGRDLQKAYPLDVQLDDVDQIPVVSALIASFQGKTELPSAFVQPWSFPTTNLEGLPVPNEHPLTEASPYRAMTDVLDMLASMPGSMDARERFESAASEAESIQVSREALETGETLGDPIDYVRYLMARLTRTTTDASRVANFNLDSDRGYGHLTWDWVRSEGRAVYEGFDNAVNPATGAVDDVSERAFRPPQRPGFGWDARQDSGDYDSPPSPHEPTTPPGDVLKVRYIDREPKVV